MPLSGYNRDITILRGGKIISRLGLLKEEIQHLFSAKKPRKLLFDHLPKCGGSALKKYLEAQYLNRKVFSIDGLDPDESVKIFRNLPQSKRYAYDLVQGHCAYHLLDYVHPSCLITTVLRDPVDRIISYYYYARSEKKHPLYQELRSSGISLDDFVTSNMTIEIRNFYTSYFLMVDADEAETDPEESIAKAVDVVLTRYNIIGFLDRLPTFADAVYHQARFKGVQPLRKMNVTTDRLAKEDVAQSTIRKIEEMNFLDLALYKALKKARGVDG